MAAGAGCFVDEKGKMKKRETLTSDESQSLVAGRARAALGGPQFAGRR